MGRRKIELTEEQIKEALEGRTVTHAAEHLGVSRSTLNNRIKELGIGIGKGHYTRKFRRRRKRSEVHTRLVEHYGSTLPSDIPRLAKILGLKPETVRAYLSRGKQTSERFLTEVLTKASKSIILYDIAERPIPLGAIKKMSVLLDKWGRTVKIYATLSDQGATIFEYKMEKLWNLLEE